MALGYHRVFPEHGAVLVPWTIAAEFERTALTCPPAAREYPTMKRFALGISLGLVAPHVTGCDKGADNRPTTPGEERHDVDDVDNRDDENSRDGNNSSAAITPADAMKYIPDGANLLIGVNTAKVVDFAVLMGNEDLLRQGDAGEMLAAADACKVGMSTWKYAVVGGNTEEDLDVVIVFSATGVGEKNTLDCIGKNITEQDPQARFDVGEEDGRVVVSRGRGGQKWYAISDDVIAIVGADSREAFEDRLDGRGKNVLEGSLKDALDSVDQSKHIYFGMLATADMRQGPTAPLQYVTGTVDLSAGITLAVSGEFGDSAKATDFSDIANRQFDELKGIAGAFGIPAGIVESVKIEAQGAAVAISVSATGDELKQLSEALSKQLAEPDAAAAADQRSN